MGALGGGNPFGFELGGGPSRVEQTYAALKSAVGIGGSAAEGTMEAEWRFAKARGWTASLDDERAMYQTWPDTAEEGGVEVFEEILRITPPAEHTLQDRRLVAEAEYTRFLSAETPSLTADLQAIDPSITIGNPNQRDTVATTVPGRAFEDADPSAPEANGPKFFQFGSSKCSLFPNYSQDFIVVVYYPITPGPLTKVQMGNLMAIKELLDEALPAWCQFQVITNIDPLTGLPACLILDQDRLDISALC